MGRCHTNVEINATRFKPRAVLASNGLMNSGDCCAPSGIFSHANTLYIPDPLQPKEVGYYIPAITEKTDKRCVGTGADQRCKTAIQTNNVEVDDRGYIYIVDRANTGMHTLELTGAARRIAKLP